MTKDQTNKRRAIIALLSLMFLCLSVVLVGIWLYSSIQGQSEACKKWEELRRHNEQKEMQLESSYPELQEGISTSQAQEIRYQRICSEKSR